MLFLCSHKQFLIVNLSFDLLLKIEWFLHNLMIKLTPNFKDRLRHRVVAVLDFINCSLMESHFLLRFLFCQGFCITLLDRGFIFWLLCGVEVETEAISNHNEAKRKLLAKIKKVVSLFFRPVCGIRDASHSRALEHQRYLFILFWSVLDDLYLSIEAGKRIRFILLLNFGPVVQL